MSCIPSEITRERYGIAAEIDRATEAFIKIVRDNPANFPEVDPETLAKYDPEIRVTSKKIVTCDTNDELDAWSSHDDNYSRFHFAAWIGKPWLAKVALAGHERLVIAKLEKSNSYKISNRVYDIETAKLEAKLGPAKPVCSFGRAACDAKKHSVESLKFILSNLGPEGIRLNNAATHIDMGQDVLETEILSMIGIKKIQVQRRSTIFSTAQSLVQEVQDFEAELRRSVDAEVMPLFREARELLAQQTQNPENTCVNLREP